MSSDRTPAPPDSQRVRAGELLSASLLIERSGGQEVCRVAVASSIRVAEQGTASAAVLPPRSLLDTLAQDADEMRIGGLTVRIARSGHSDHAEAVIYLHAPAAATAPRQIAAGIGNEAGPASGSTSELDHLFDLGGGSGGTTDGHW